MTRHILDVTVPADWDRRGLPGWSYHSPAFLELEKEHVFRTHWQIVGHISDVPEPGNYLTMDVVGERALIVRGRDGVVRGFHNICRHRGSRLCQHGFDESITSTARFGALRVPAPFRNWTRPSSG